MMKWRVKTETTNIGVLELGDLTLDEDCMEISIDICDMSEDLKAEVERVIEIKKLEYTRRYEGINAEHGTNIDTVWSDKPVIMYFTYLRVKLEAGKAISYTIEFAFCDADNEMMEVFDGSIPVDLSGIEGELKKLVIKVLVDRFF